MKWYLPVLILFSLTATAQDKCIALFGTFNWSEYRHTSDELFKKALHGDASKAENEVYFYWHTANPSTLTKVGPDSYTYTYSGKRMVTYSNHPDISSEAPLQSLGTLMGTKPVSNSKLLKDFIKNYEGKAAEEVIQEIEYIESQISFTADDRQSFGYVATAPADAGGTILGTYRVYNGTTAHSDTNPDLPSERSFAYRKIHTKTAAFLKEKRQKSPTLPIFELGKFSIHGSTELRERTRTLIELFWLRYFINNAPDEAIFVAHVDSKAHRRLYESRYGFKLFEKIMTPGQETSEYILMATAAQLRTAFVKLYPTIQPPAVQITTP